MGIDLKYGRVTTERGDIAADEPVVVFRAQDRLLTEVLRMYRALCAVAGSPDHHLMAIVDSEEVVRAWQQDNPTRTPRSDSLQ